MHLQVCFVVNRINNNSWQCSQEDHKLRVACKTVVSIYKVRRLLE